MKETFWDVVCGMIPWWRTLVIVDIVVLVLLLYSVPFLEPGGGSFVVAGLTLGVVAVTLSLYGIVRIKCADR